jgi:two-component system response regulator NreC
MTSTTALVISDELIPRLGIRHLISSDNRFTVVGDAGTKEAIERVSKHKPDAILVHSTGYVSSELIASLHQASPRSGIVVLSQDVSESYIGLLWSAGVLGYVLLSASPRELFHAILEAAKGRRFIDPRLSEEIFALVARHATTDTKALSTREEQVLQRLAYGYGPKEIASQLKISRRSVETYQARIREKLGLRTRVDIVRYALSTGILNEKSA